MAKKYETPKVEKMDFDYKETVTASNGSGLTDESTNWWKCETRIIDIKNIEGTVCGYV